MCKITTRQVVAPDALFGVRKEKLNRGSIIIRRSLSINIHVNKQTVLLAPAARTAEFAELKQDLEQAQGGLDLTRRQLEESKGE